MGQKFAAYNAGGAIVGFYDSFESPVPSGVTAIQITDAQWQACISQPGWTVVNGALVAPVAPTSAQLLAQAQTAQIAMLSTACQSAITAGFTSSALGKANSYGSQLTDQNNLLSALSASQGQVASWTTPLWCLQSGAWAFQPHSAAQVAQVNNDWVAFRTALQSKYAGLVAQVQAASTVAAVQAIAWK